MTTASLVPIEAPRGFVKLDVTPVPEIAEQDAIELLAEIFRRQALPLPASSYGAFVVRAMSRDAYIAAVHSMARIGKQTGRKHKYSEFSGFGDGIHTDEGPANDTTIHRTKEGATDFHILIGSTMYSSVAAVEAAQRLCTSQVLDLSALTPPKRTLHTVLHEGDVIFFDNYEPHSFVGLRNEDGSHNRKSRADYLLAD